MNETRSDFLNGCAEHLAPASLEVMKRGMDALDRFFPQSLDDADWSRENVDEYRNWLSAAYKPGTAALYGEFVLGHFLRFLGHSALFARIERVYRTRTYNNTELGIPDEPLEAMIQLIPLVDEFDFRNRVILELLLKTGPKVTELVRAFSRDVDFRNGWIIYRHDDVARTVPFDAVLGELLQEYISRWRSLLESTHDDHLLLTRTGKPLGRTQVWRVVAHHFRDFGEISPNDLRNEFIARLLRNGVSRHRIVALAGLSHVSLTYVYELGSYRGGPDYRGTR